MLDCTDLVSRLLSHAGGKQISVVSYTPPEQDLIAGFGFFSDDPLPSPDIHKDLGTILIENGAASPQDIETGLAKQNRKLGHILVDEGLVKKEHVEVALQQQKTSGHKQDDTIRISLRKLDSVLRLVGELSIQSAIVKNASLNNNLNDEKSKEAVSLSSKIIQDLQTEGMSLRMQPLESLFQRMERVSRDVARQQNKAINVVLLGTDVELDKTVIEKMKDPLVHILRNAVDHGIESMDDRNASKKPNVATITIEGVQTASNVSIRISDDGKGLDTEKIRKKAIEKGLIDANQKLTKAEIHNLIFAPSFSTAEKVTDVSGRGVGMDVVRKSVDELQGTIAIDSTFGLGTLFEICLPSTLSIVDAIVITLGGRQFAVPVQDVSEVVDMSSMQVTTSQGRRLINLRGKVLMVEKLIDFLPQRLNENQLEPIRNPVAMITNYKGVIVAFEVDRIDGQQSIVVRQLEENLALVPGFSGGTILSNGEPSMIINFPSIIKSFEKETTKTKEAA